jgi:hypothetical protein
MSKEENLRAPVKEQAKKRAAHTSRPLRRRTDDIVGCK